MRAGAALREPLESDVAARVMVASLCALLSWWAERGMPESPAEVQRLFEVCTAAMMKR